MTECDMIYYFDKYVVCVCVCVCVCVYVVFM